jgi:hypothetical protein
MKLFSTLRLNSSGLQQTSQSSIKHCSLNRWVNNFKLILPTMWTVKIMFNHFNNNSLIYSAIILAFICGR